MDLFDWLKAQGDRATGIALVAIGLLAIVLGYRGVADATLPTEQIPYLASGGILGVFALGCGATLWLSADLRDEWRKLDEIHETLQANATAAAEASAVATDRTDPSSTDEGLSSASPEATSTAIANGRRRSAPLRAPSKR